MGWLSWCGDRGGIGRLHHRGRFLFRARLVLATRNPRLLYLPLRRSLVSKDEIKLQLLAHTVLEEQLGLVLLASTPPRGNQRPEEDAGMDPKVADGALYSVELHLCARIQPGSDNAGVLVGRVEQLLQFVVVGLNLAEQTLPGGFAVAEF